MSQPRREFRHPSLRLMPADVLEQPFQTGTLFPKCLNASIRMLLQYRHADAEKVFFRSSGKTRKDYFFSVAGSMRTGLWISNRLLRSR